MRGNVFRAAAEGRRGAMKIPTPVDVGYFAKVTRDRPEWLEAPVVEEVCSVSECISAGPENWILKWLHNGLGFFDSETLALQVVTTDRDAFNLYAYRIVPLEFDEGVVRPWQPPVGSIDLDLGDYESLGCDIASRSAGCNFECSPLSCNGAAVDFPVNRHCLIPDVAAAYRAAVEISRGNYEPGPYHLLEVHRRKPGT